MCEKSCQFCSLAGKRLITQCMRHLNSNLNITLILFLLDSLTIDMIVDTFSDAKGKQMLQKPKSISTWVVWLSRFIYLRVISLSGQLFICLFFWYLTQIYPTGGYLCAGMSLCKSNKNPAQPTETVSTIRLLFMTCQTDIFRIGMTNCGSPPGFGNNRATSPS